MVKNKDQPIRLARNGGTGLVGCTCVMFSTWDGVPYLNELCP